MRKVQINDAGDTTFLEQELVDKLDFAAENDRIWGKKVVVDPETVRTATRVRYSPFASCVRRTLL